MTNNSIKRRKYEHKPLKAIYDFHHNLRAFDFTDARVHREGIHIKTYHDAGEHRVMFAKGGNITVEYAAAYKGVGANINTIMESSEWVYWDVGWGIYIIGRYLGDRTEEDSTIGLMVKYLGKTKGHLSFDPFWSRDVDEGTGILATWRRNQVDEDFAVYVSWIDVYVSVGTLSTPQADWDEGVTLNVEDFPHWVWVYGVERNDANNDRLPDDQYEEQVGNVYQRFATVQFTYTHPSGQNLFDVTNPERWPSYYRTSSTDPWTDVNLPWFSDFTQKDSKYLPTTELIWYWHAYDYNPTGSPNPSATTRYHDGSP